MTNEARKRISDATKKRWQEYRARKNGKAGNGVKADGNGKEFYTVSYTNEKDAKQNATEVFQHAQSLGAQSVTFNLNQNTVSLQF